ncbi:MAG: damage-control phosphatase ARMT1 family protein [Chloroflexota bacterium]
MRAYLDCYPCFLRQALDAARMAGADEQGQRKILGRVLDVLQSATLSTTPPQISHQVHRIVRQETGADDPYGAAKARSTEQALALYPWMEQLLADADDRLETAVRLSIGGNIIDMAADAQYDLREEVRRVLREPFGIDDGEAFRAALDEAEEVLYLADNAGETVFDRLLIKFIAPRVIYAVKGHPTINDATIEDAKAAGVDQVAQLMSNGSDAPGTVLEACSDRFRRTYEAAELIIAKGQANYETLSDEGPRVFFLLQTKCPVIARDLSAPHRSLILHQGRGGRGPQDGGPQDGGPQYEKETQP